MSERKNESQNIRKPEDFRTTEVKLRVKRLLKMLNHKDMQLSLEEILIDSFTDEYDAREFLIDLIDAEGVKKNILIAVMDWAGFFDDLEDDSDARGEAHDEWWYGEARAEGFLSREEDDSIEDD